MRLICIVERKILFKKSAPSFLSLTEAPLHGCQNTFSRSHCMAVRIHFPGLIITVPHSTIPSFVSPPPPPQLWLALYCSLVPPSSCDCHCPLVHPSVIITVPWFIPLWLPLSPGSSLCDCHCPLVHLCDCHCARVHPTDSYCYSFLVQPSVIATTPWFIPQAVIATVPWFIPQPMIATVYMFVPLTQITNPTVPSFVLQTMNPVILCVFKFCCGSSIFQSVVRNGNYYLCIVLGQSILPFPYLVKTV